MTNRSSTRSRAWTCAISARRMASSAPHIRIRAVRRSACARAELITRSGAGRGAGGDAFTAGSVSVGSVCVRPRPKPQAQNERSEAYTVGMTTKLIGIPKLADALGVDQSTVHRRIARQAIEPTHVADDGCVYWTPEAAQAILHGPEKPSEPTYFKPMPYGPDHVVNPNVCGICHKSRHRDTPHHDFEAAAASVEYATRAGWPLPTNQEPML